MRNNIKTLIACEIADFFAGFGSPGEPQTPEEMQGQLLARINRLFADWPEYHWKELDTPECPSTPAERELIGGCQWLDWNQLSALGLIRIINKDLLHPMGLALFRDPNNGISQGALISSDAYWEYEKTVNGEE